MFVLEHVGIGGHFEGAVFRGDLSAQLLSDYRVLGQFIEASK